MIETNTLPHKQSTDDRRAAIALAARAIIVEKGVEGLRTRDIADRVGINIATLHYHVPSKEALIELVAESLKLEFIQQTIDRPRAHLPAVERMDLEFVDFREIALEKPEVMLVFSELIERARRDERIAEAILPMKRRWRQILVDMLSEGVSDGVYRDDMDPEAAATIIMSSMIGFCRSPHKHADAFDRLVTELQRAIRKPQRDAVRADRQATRELQRGARQTKRDADLSKPTTPARQSKVTTSKE